MQSVLRRVLGVCRPTRLLFPRKRTLATSNRIYFMSSALNASISSLPALYERTPVSTDVNRPFVRTAACLIIGDEVLNGKTHDTNSNKMAKLCFELGIELKRVEVIPDVVEDIMEAVQRMVRIRFDCPNTQSRNYDLVVTSGGIGPTPDDITYESIAKAFAKEPLEYDDETLHRMEIGIRQRFKDLPQTDAMTEARKRMALFPRDSEVIFPTEQLWVPVVRVNGNVCILPGIPSLFEALLNAMQPYLRLDPNMPRPIRTLIETTLPESVISPLLQRLTASGKKDGVRVGSYPKWDKGVHISFIGFDQSVIDKYVEQAIHETGGVRISTI